MQRKKRTADSVFAGSSALQGVNRVGRIDRWMDDVLGVVCSGAAEFAAVAVVLFGKKTEEMETVAGSGCNGNMLE
ncbi:hypothetical protein F0562_003421 [Nyssa sinensis]|uniref:Uncharacterized protein n=1 Tax=Nyssa sinensis TaxID=561372 RepID=A0A5J5BZD0_9ASTE|nr:hypothetical protein F0562_003421 [Nyssa sinensis]